MLEIFNLIEAGLWISFGVALQLVSRKLEVKHRRVAYVGVAALVAFGISDIIEIYTGAWWKPIWLLLLKAACIVVFIGCCVYYLKNKSKDV